MNHSVQINKKNKTIKVENKSYQIWNFLVHVDSSFFNPFYLDRFTSESRRLKALLRKEYWDLLSFFVQKKYSIVVRLSGLHLKIDELRKDIRYSSNGRREIFLHYHYWPFGNKGLHDEGMFALINCDRDALRELFDKFWFVVGYELRFEGIVLRVGEVSKLRKLCQFGESITGRRYLISRSELIFDNLENGFNFRVTTKPAYSELFARWQFIGK